MLVSIILITHNFEKYVEETLASIANQTYKDIEVIVVDDASTDKTIKIIKKIAEKNPRVKVFQNKNNLGKARSFNIGIKKSRGEFIVQFDGDDTMPKDRIKKQVEFMEKHPDVMMSYGDMIKVVDGKEEMYISPILKNPLKRMKERRNDESLRTDHTWRILHDKKYIPGTSAMIRKEVFRSGIKMDGNIWAATDYDLWLQIIGKGFKIAKADIIGLIYRIHGAQMSKKRDKNEERGYIFNKLHKGDYFK